MKKKILIVSQHFYPEIGSAGNRMKNIYALLIEKGYDISILTTDPAYPNRQIYEDPEFWDDDSILDDSSKIVRIKVQNRKYSRSIFNRLVFYLEVAYKLLGNILKDKSKYDIVFATSPPIFIAIVGVFAKFKFKSKLILDIRDLWPESLRGVGVFDNIFILKLFGSIEKSLYRKADFIIVNSKGFIQSIAKALSGSTKNIYYLPNSAREHEVGMTKYNGEKAKVIYTGNIGLAQDIDFLKRLASKLNENNIELTIISYGIKNQDFKQYVKSKRMENIKIISPLTRKKCLDIIREHHIGVVSLNNKEVFETVLPGKVVDYMTCSIPIVGSVSGYSKEIIEKYNVGFVSEDRDVNDIYDYIKLLINDPNKRMIMAENCEKCIESNFLWEKNIDILESIIEQCDSK
ncbi:glycosyltransferase family 4 protein [Bacillus niameyensis]|uniref:glycosyltransferase family 4 protein n=1 Tax=Bacillus niameyensis TaxID=1522308 RepID=UPI0007837CD0|nr:glycosyltransferase family 4 protein [Bacillus niameyensis]